MKTVVRLVALTAACTAVWAHGVWTGARIAPVLLQQRARKLAAQRATETDL